jgi:hypothetical protein
VIRDNDVVIYDFAFRRLGDGRHATQESSKNYGPFEQKSPLTSKIRRMRAIITFEK